MTNNTQNLSPKYTIEKTEDRPGITIIKVITRLEIDHLGEIDQIIDKIIGGDCKTIIEMTLEEKVMEVKIIETEVEVETIMETCTERTTEIIIEMTIDQIIILEEDRSRTRERHSLQTSRRDDGSSSRSTSRSRTRSCSRVSMNRDRIRCYKCRKYDQLCHR